MGFESIIIWRERDGWSVLSDPSMMSSRNPRAVNAVGRIAGEYVAARTSKSFSRSLTLRFADMVNFTMVSLPHRLLSRVPTRALPRTGRSRTFLSALFIFEK